MAKAIRQPCRNCGHIKSLHYPPAGLPGKRRYPCNLIGCKCKNFVPELAPASQQTATKA